MKLLSPRILAAVVLFLMVSATTATLFHPRKRPFYFLVDYEVEAFEISDTGELNYTYPKHRGDIFV